MIEKEKQHTIYDISKKAGVSIATVSRVLNNSPKVSRKTRERVLEVIKESGYEPNAYARGLGSGSMKTIGILCSDVADIYLANAVSFLEKNLRQNGFNTVLNCTGDDYKTKVRCMKAMEGQRVDAVILAGSQYIESISSRNQYIIDVSRHIPVMLLNGYIKGDNIYCNLSDDYSAFYDAVKELYQKGGRKILFLYREISYSRNLKHRGYCDALKDCGIEVDDSLILRCGGKMEQIKQQLISYYKEGHEFDSVLACDDELAIGAMKFVKEMGIKVPADMAIIGCNNSVLSICCSPELSSIDNKCELLCVNTVSLLMRILDGQEAVHKTLLSTDYIPRGTTKK